MADQGAQDTTEHELYAWGDRPDFLQELPEQVDQARVRAICLRPNYALVLSEAKRVYALGLAKDAALVPSDRLAEHRIEAIAAGQDHALALNEYGQVLGWGSNAKQQCELPEALAGEQVTAICAGAFHSLALTASGRVHAWGSNHEGQLEVPQALQSAKIVQISARGNHSLALAETGRVFAWGADEQGQSSIPDAFRSQTYEAIAAGGDFSMGILESGLLFCWGGEDSSVVHDYCELPIDAKAQKIWAGDSSAFALLRGGELVSLGDARRTRSQVKSLASHPQVQVSQIESAGMFQLAHLVITPEDASRACCELPLAPCSESSTLMAQQGDQVQSKGSNATPSCKGCAPDQVEAPPETYLLTLDNSRVPRSLLPATDDTEFELVTGSSPDRLALVRRAAPDTPLKIQKIASGDRHSLALTDKGELYAWGHDDSDQLQVPSEVAQHEIVSISISDSNNIAVSREGRVFIWGCCMEVDQIPEALERETIVDAVAGTCMNIVRTQSNRIYTFGGGVPDEIPELIERTQDPYVQVAGGRVHCVGLTESGKVLNWGGEDDSEDDRPPLQLPPALAEHQILAVDGGDNLSWALSREGKLFCWHIQESDELHLMLEDPSMVEIAAAGTQCVVLTREGKVLRLDQEEGPRSVRALAQSGAVAIACGEKDVLVLTEDGELRTWGTWGYEFGETQLYRTPGNALQGIAVGDAHALVLREHGGPLVWSHKLSGTHFVAPSLAQASAYWASISNQGLMLMDLDGQVQRWKPCSPQDVEAPSCLEGREIEKLLPFSRGFLAITDSGELLIWNDELEELVPTPEELSKRRIIDAATCHDLFAAIDKEGGLHVWDEESNELHTLPPSYLECTHTAIHACENYFLVRTDEDCMHVFGYSCPGTDSIPEELQGQALRKLVTCGDSFFALTEEGAMHKWGDECADAFEMPELLEREDLRVVDIACGPWSNFALVEMVPRAMVGQSCRDFGSLSTTSSSMRPA